MPSKQFQDAVRPLRLTIAEEIMVAEESDRLVAETLAVNELFIACDRKMPKSDWKYLKTKENVQVYRAKKEALASLERECSESGYRKRSSTVSTDSTSSGYSDEGGRRTESTSYRSTDSSSSDDSPKMKKVYSCDNSVIGMSKPPGAPLVVATGIITGTVEDAAFGAVAHTDRLWRQRNAHLQSEFEDTMTLAQIRVPTPQDPFTSLVVRWATKNIGPLSRTRDCVSIEATGIALDSRGERFAYSVKHSIDWIARLPSLKHLDVVRAKSSMCYITRQYDASSVEIFCRGFADSACTSDLMCTDVFPNMVLSYVHVVDCSYVRKLEWLMYMKRLKRAPSIRSRSDPSHCAVCSSTFCKLSTLMKPWAPCQACDKVICPKCAVVKNLPMDVGNTSVKLTPATFCLHCMVEAKEAPACSVAATMMQV
uniref:FYVE-type domain-containing protein n=1 Tax=Globisporangium ultimum (strain ATCC 200006 / CBS 805.95 / DAOM BR144) TaxID=431595 RepID=K3WFW8_GLOUD